MIYFYRSKSRKFIDKADDASLLFSWAELIKIYFFVRKFISMKCKASKNKKGISKLFGLKILRKRFNQKYSFEITGIRLIFKILFCYTI